MRIGDVYHVSVTASDGWPACATREYSRIVDSHYPHQVLKEYADQRAALLSPGDVIIAHRERDHANFVARVSEVVPRPRVEFV